MWNQHTKSSMLSPQVEEYSDEVFDLLSNGAHIFFCGLKGMMPGIQEMLQRVATEKGYAPLPARTPWVPCKILSNECTE